MAALTLFYSYAHEDEALRDQLEKHLVQLQRQGLLSTWHDRKILPGESFAQEIDTHLEAASIILLLVSSDFLASDYCYEIEMQRTLERHKRGIARVIPIILRPCDWQHSPLKDLQCLPRSSKPVTEWDNPDAAFLDIAKGLRKVIEQQKALARSSVPLSPLERQNRMRMLKQVQRIWIEGLLTKSLHQAAKIELGLQDRSDVLENPWQLQVQELDQTPEALPNGTTIVQVYDNADGELLILGEPGAGKTTLLLELTRTLLERAEEDERLAMPIVFNLSSWAEKRQPLRTWLAEELRTKYQVPRKIGQGWIDADQVLPLLDGLDEVAKDARTACVQQINDYYQSRLERGNCPIVVCCRSEEYTALSANVALQHAVCILPLTDEQITTYLEQAGRQVKGLRQSLDEDVELHELARQPLMLNIFALAYQGEQDLEVLTGETREGMRRTIFATYVERMLKRRGQSKRWKLAQVTRWLTFLAIQMHQRDQTIFSVENLQPSWLSRRWMILYKWCVRLPIGVIFSLIGGLVFGLGGWLIGGLVVGLLFGLLFGLVFGLLIGLSFGLDPGINSAEVLIWSWKEGRSGLVSGLVGALVLGLSGGLLGGLLGEQDTSIHPPEKLGWSWAEALAGLAGWLAVGLLGGLAFGLVFGLSRRQLPESLSLSPNEGIWHTGKNGLVGGLASGLVFGLGGGVAIGLSGGLVVGLAFGPVFGLFLGLGAFMKHFLLRFLLSQQGDFPKNLVAFLDEATERLLLRKVGGSYIFVHRLLLEYFVELGGKDDSHQ